MENKINENSKIIESHAHYDDSAFDEDRDALLLSMKENNIETIINIGSTLESNKTILHLLEEYSFVYGALGVHPSDASILEEKDIKWIEEQCKLPKVVAIGEIGLDYYWQEPSREIQQKWFVRQMELAIHIGLPMVIHSRDAAKDTLDYMKDTKAEKAGGVIHCFSYGKEMAKEFLEMGFYLGIGGVVTFTNAKKLKEVVEYIPLDRILLETDSPYLAPVPNRGKRNTSLNLPFIAREIAAIKNITYEEVVAVTHNNTRQLFKLGGK